eukprot:UN31572
MLAERLNCTLCNFQAEDDDEFNRHLNSKSHYKATKQAERSGNLHLMDNSNKFSTLTSLRKRRHTYPEDRYQNNNVHYSSNTSSSAYSSPHNNHKRRKLNESPYSSHSYDKSSPDDSSSKSSVEASWKVCIICGNTSHQFSR